MDRYHLHAASISADTHIALTPAADTLISCTLANSPWKHMHQQLHVIVFQQ